MEKELFELEQKLKQSEKLKGTIDKLLEEFVPGKDLKELETEFKNINEEELLKQIAEVNEKIKALESQLQI